MITEYKQWCNKHTDIIKLAKRLKSSKPEQYIGFYLSKAFGESVEYQKMFDWLGRKSLDIYVPQLKLAVEYDGICYHKYRIEDDCEKDEICRSHGIEVVRIHEENTPKLSHSENDFFYVNDRDYNNINIPVDFLHSYIHHKYGMLIMNDVNVKRDYEEILSYIQNKYYKKTVAYVWPESREYWYDDSASIYDVFFTDNGCYDLKCPHCGNVFKFYMRYFHERKSLIPCECEYSTIDSLLYNAKNKYINENILVAFNETLQSRRLYDRMETEVRYYLLDKTQQELEMYKKLGFESPMLDYLLSEK